MLHPELTPTMTEEEKNNAVARKYVGARKTNPLSDLNSPNFDSSYLQRPITNPPESLNFSSGISSFCAESLIGHETLMKKKAEMKQKQLESEDIKEVIKQGKRISAGLAFKCNTVRLGKTILDIQKEKLRDKEQKVHNTAVKEYNTYMKRKVKVDLLRLKKKDELSWTMGDYKAVNIF